MPRPKILYHYTTQEALLGIFSQKCIWATNIHFLNDSTEFDYAINLTLEALYSTDKERSWADNEFPRRIKNVLESNDKLNIYVTSFSEKGDLLSQWRAYCSSSIGFSIGFSYGKISTLGREQGFILGKCIYDGLEQKKMISQILKEAYRIYTNESNEELLSPHDRAISSFIHGFVEVAPFLKDPSFSEEEEWRLVSLRNILSSDLKFKSGKSMIIPYTEVNLINDKKELPFTEIIIGPAPHMDLSHVSLKHLIDSENCKCILKLSKVPYRTW